MCSRDGGGGVVAESRHDLLPSIGTGRVSPESWLEQIRCQVAVKGCQRAERAQEPKANRRSGPLPNPQGLSRASGRTERFVRSRGHRVLALGDQGQSPALSRILIRRKKAPPDRGPGRLSLPAACGVALGRSTGVENQHHDPGEDDDRLHEREAEQHRGLDSAGGAGVRLNVMPRIKTASCLTLLFLPVAAALLRETSTHT